MIPGLQAMTKIDAALIEAIAAHVHGVQPGPGRAQDIAREVDGLVNGLGAVLPVDFLGEPDDFRATLWALSRADEDDGR